MKLVPTTEKVTIQWFAVLHDGSKVRNNKGFIHNAWDAKCSCGWESRTGGAIKACVQREVEAHKWDAHNYSWKVRETIQTLKTANKVLVEMFGEENN